MASKIARDTKLRIPNCRQPLLAGVAVTTHENLLAGAFFITAVAASSVATHAAMEGDSGEKRLTPNEFEFPHQGNPGTGSSGVGGIQTVVLKGDPNEAGVYTIMLRVPAHTQHIPIVMIVWQQWFQELGILDTETSSMNRS